MNKLQVFNNPDFGEIRTAEINSEPWFVGKDVAEALGYEKPTDAVRKHVDEEDRGISKMETPSGKTRNDHHQRVRPVQYSRNGHDGVSMQYSESVKDRVWRWLQDNGFPESIGDGNRTCSVVYRKQ